MKMANQVECLCHLDENHHEIGCFFKYVIFLLKRFVSSRDHLTIDPKDAQKEIFKNDIWMQIATQYDSYFTGKISPLIHLMNDSIQCTQNKQFLLCIDCETDSSCVDGCVLKLLQKSAEKELKILAR